MFFKDYVRFLFSMKRSLFSAYALCIVGWCFSFGACSNMERKLPVSFSIDSLPPISNFENSHASYWICAHETAMNTFLETLDTISLRISEMSDLDISEYHLVHANRWILDSLISQDYYKAMQAGRKIIDTREIIILHQGDSLRIPSKSEVDSISLFLASITIDVNIPEFTLRIMADNQMLYRCICRVGKNERKYLALAGHEVDLRTPIGEGSIVRIERNPMYMNPVDGHRYTSTRRDDGTYTALPRIPFLEPELNGIRYGSLIHPTTNYSTLGKAISNGCVGLSEADAWMVYYHAPLGTRVRFRYDLEVIDSTGQRKTLRDIYQKNTSPK